VATQNADLPNILKANPAKSRRSPKNPATARPRDGGHCFGYDVVHQPAGNGEIERGLRRINDREAGLVRRIFTEFAAGRSPRRIAMDLMCGRPLLRKRKIW